MRDRLPLILSTTALVVAVLGVTPLGEAAYNALAPRSVGTAQLKNNAITAAKLRKGSVTNAKLRGDAVTSGKVKNRSLRAIDFKLGQLPAGPPGPKGAKGDKGDPGDPASLGDGAVTTAKLADGVVTSAKIGNGEVKAADLGPAQIVTGEIRAIQANSRQSVPVYCPAGTRVLSGGASASDFGIRMVYSYPYKGNGWYAGYKNTTAVVGTIQAFAICLKG